MIPLTQINELSLEMQPVSRQIHDDVQSEFSRLLHAAVINKNFREKLLNNPTNCIESGFCGEKFHFPRELASQIKQIKARSLQEFSLQMTKLIQQPTMPEMAMVYCR